MNIVPSHTRKAHRVNVIPRNVSVAPEDRRLDDASFSSFDAGAGYRHHNNIARRQHDHAGPMMRPTGKSTLFRNQDDEGSQKRELEELADALQDLLHCLEGSQKVLVEGKLQG